MLPIHHMLLPVVSDCHCCSNDTTRRYNVPTTGSGTSTYTSWSPSTITTTQTTTTTSTKTTTSLISVSAVFVATAAAVMPPLPTDIEKYNAVRTQDICKGRIRKCQLFSSKQQQKQQHIQYYKLFFLRVYLYRLLLLITFVPSFSTSFVVLQKQIQQHHHQQHPFIQQRPRTITSSNVVRLNLFQKEIDNEKTTSITRPIEKQQLLSNLPFQFLKLSSLNRESTSNVNSNSKSYRVPPSVLNDLQSKQVTFPYTFRCSNDNTNNKNSIKNNNDDNDVLYTIRIVEYKDVQTIGQLCVHEYSTPVSTLSFSSSISSVFENFDNWFYNTYYLRIVVELTTFLKVPILQQQKVPLQTQQQQNQQQDQQTVPNDHVFLLLTQTAKPTIQNEKNNKECIIGMIEISRQPIIPTNNPSPFPIPLFIKQLYCTIAPVLELLSNNKQSTSTNRRNRIPIGGWITNLLILQQYRGYGFSKVLVIACEMIVKYYWTDLNSNSVYPTTTLTTTRKTTNTNSKTISLHCDADEIDGKIAQRLYTKLGYLLGPITFIDSNNDNNNNNNNSIDVNTNGLVFVNDIPLLYLQKEIK